MSRIVKLLVLSFRDEDPEKIWNTLTEQAEPDTDLILLPELWMGDEAPMETEEGEAFKKASDMARTLGVYLICPVYYTDGRQRYNSALVFDREGSCICRYDKVFPYWEELERVPPCTPGQRAGIFETDFGRCGIATCFDVNFPELWSELDQRGAELVLWPSDYSAGRALQAHAMTHHYYVVSATRFRDTAVYDITGDEILYNRSGSITVTKVTLDLDRGLYHENFNLEACDSLLREHPEIRLEQSFPREQWFLLSGNEDVLVRALAKEYGLEELRSYLHRSRSVHTGTGKGEYQA